MAACLWHASKVLQHNRLIVRLLRRAKGTLLLFVGNIDFDIRKSFEISRCDITGLLSGFETRLWLLPLTFFCRITTTNRPIAVKRGTRDMSTTAIAGENYSPHQFAASHDSARRRLLRSLIRPSSRQLTQSDVKMSRVPRLSQGILASLRSMIPRHIIAHCSLLIANCY